MSSFSTYVFLHTCLQEQFSYKQAIKMWIILKLNVKKKRDKMISITDDCISQLTRLLAWRQEAVWFCSHLLNQFHLNSFASCVKSLCTILAVIPIPQSHTLDPQGVVCTFPFSREMGYFSAVSSWECLRKRVFCCKDRSPKICRIVGILQSLLRNREMAGVWYRINKPHPRPS